MRPNRDFREVTGIEIIVIQEKRRRPLLYREMYTTQEMRQWRVKLRVPTLLTDEGRETRLTVVVQLS